ncbi:MAG: hypothetical protein K9J13_13395 [Saprospiraceae bacterium]|nr:hypothetical protein [Saprospiraceae bacterium]
MKKKILLLLLIGIGVTNSYSQNKKSFFKDYYKKINKDQVLHFGIRPLFSYTSMSMGDYKGIGFQYHIANEKNESILSESYSWADGNDAKYTLYPDIYLKYDFGNHVFFQIDMFGLWFTNSVEYRNSVDISDYYDTFRDDFSGQGYNELKVSWWFLGNSFTTGVSFFKTKAIQPYIFGGGSSFYLNGFNIADYSGYRFERNYEIYSKLDTYRRFTLFWNYGLGVKYRGFALDFFVQNSQARIDINDYKENGEASNYYYFDIYNFSLKVNLYSININKNKLKNK